MILAPVAILNAEANLLDRRVFTNYLLDGTKGPEAFDPNLSCLEFRGSGVIGGTFYTRSSEVSQMLKKYQNIEKIISLMKTASGSFTLVIFDRTTRSLYFLNDPLGGGFLMQYRKGAFTAISTDLTSLRQVVHSHGYETTRDPLYELSQFATGTQSHAADTPFLEISVEDSGLGLRISADGRLDTVDYGVNNYLYSGEQANEQDLIDQGIEEIKTNLSAVLNYQPPLMISDITGGFDSRLVLAGLSALGACDSVVLRSIKHLPEWEYAEGLAATYRMELTDGSSFGEVWGIKHDLYEDSVASARKSGGIISNEMGRNSIPYPVIKLQGGYGGAFRSFGSHFHPDSQEINVLEFGKSSWKWGRINQFTINGEMILNHSLSDHLSRRAARTIGKGIQVGVPNSHISNYWYAKGRLRYWFGQQSYHSSRPIAQFDPLYNTSLISAAYRTDFSRRKANMIGLQALRKLDANLLEYPFYNRGLPTQMFLDENPEVTKRPFADRPYTYRKLDFSPVSRIKADLRRDLVNREDKERAFNLSLKPEHIAGLRKWGFAGYEAVMENSTLRKFFNPTALNKLLIDPFADRQTTQGAIDLLGTLFRSGLIRPESQSQEDKFIFG